MSKHTGLTKCVFVFFMAMCSMGNAGVIPESKAVDCIIGEAESEGYEGMVAVAYALRNRGTTHGVFGCSSDRVKEKRYSYVTFIEASEAWRFSGDNKDDDPTDGATGWGNQSDIKRFNKLRWFKSFRITCRIKNHTFFKENRDEKKCKKEGIGNAKSCNVNNISFNAGSYASKRD